MKVIKKGEEERHYNSKECVAFEYSLDNPNINLTRIELSGRYPEKGYVVNKICTEVSYVLTGSASVTFKHGETVTLEVGDVILLDKGDQYFWDGNCSLCIACSPAWYPEQHKIIREDVHKRL